MQFIACVKGMVLTLETLFFTLFAALDRAVVTRTYINDKYDLYFWNKLISTF